MSIERIKTERAQAILDISAPLSPFIENKEVRALAADLLDARRERDEAKEEAALNLESARAEAVAHDEVEARAGREIPDYGEPWQDILVDSDGRVAVLNNRGDWRPLPSQRTIACVNALAGMDLDRLFAALKGEKS